MPSSGPPTEQEIWRIARRTAKIIEDNISPNVCLFGSAASSLWADIDRVPNVRRATHLVFFRLKRLLLKTQDIDIVVSEEDLDPEDIKEAIVDADDRYYLVRSRKRGATYRILYRRLPGYKTDPERCVKVDILVPPTLGLPEIDESDVVLFDDIPVMPIFDLLVMKTQGWWDHRTSDRASFRAKESDDVSDILALLKCAKEERISYEDEADEERHSEEFMEHAMILAKRFVRIYGKQRRWRALGFPV